VTLDYYGGALIKALIVHSHGKKSLNNIALHFNLVGHLNPFSM